MRRRQSLGQRTIEILVAGSNAGAVVRYGHGGSIAVPAEPNLDALAERSVVFDRAYLANPVCSPNRST